MAIIMKTGGGSGKPNVLTIAIDTGAMVTATSGEKVVAGVSVDGKAVLKLPKPGTWSLYAELDGQTTEDVITISDDYPVECSFGLALSSLAEGTLVQLNESGSAVNYRVVHQGLPSSLYDSSCNGTWVLREDIYTTMAWDSSDNDYQNSNIHSYLTGTFLELFDSTTQAVVKQVKIPYQNGTGSGGSVASGSSGLHTKIFLLGCYELGLTINNNGFIPIDGVCLDYFSGTSATDSKRIAYYNGTANYWWPRSPYLGSTASVWGIKSDGGYANCVLGLAAGIRPAMVLDGMVNPTPNADGSYTLIV